MVTRPHVLVACWASLLGCREKLDDNLSELRGPRILAVRAEPAEAEPGDEVRYTVLYADRDGERGADEVRWSFCVARKPLDELGPVSDDCLEATGSELLPLGQGATVTAALPDDACRLFGPDRPAPEPGQPAARAVDPDSTGGYYQPLQLRAGKGTSVASSRLLCGLSDAKPELITEFNRRYRVNENIEIASLRGEATLPPGATASFQVAWADCGQDPEDCAPDCEAPKGCTGSERYLWFDPEARTLKIRREAVVVSWFATSGRFAVDHTGRAEEEADETSSENEWTAPDEEGPVQIFAVVRDDRGGVGWQSVEIIVAR